MGNIQSTPPSSTATSYDVFLSFRGEDTRDTFTSYLYAALHKKDIRTFIDDKELEKGDTIGPNLLKNIEESKISVVVLSKDYASSKWCLHELVKIMEYKEKNGQIVIPVFYYVDPSHVRKQIGSFKDSFVKHEKECHEDAPKWRKALTEASNLSGWDSSVTKPEATLVAEIVKDIEKKLIGGDIWSSSDFEGLIGLEERIEGLLSLLCLHKTSDIRIIGISGMGGIGKTTIAEVIFKKISDDQSHQFEGTCFLRNVRERLENCGGLVDSLQQEFLSDVLEEDPKNLKLDGSTIFSKKIKERLSQKKVFIVLDDVDDLLKLEKLAGGLKQFGPGSRIMMTSRDKQVLLRYVTNTHNIHEVKGLNYHEALKLFCNYAFKKDQPTEDLKVLSETIANYAKGNPLALKVLGSLLYQKKEVVWKSAITNLQTHIKGQIFDVLKISYDSLEIAEKNIFLDIACFPDMRCEKEVAKLHDNYSDSLSVLEAKSLILVMKYGDIIIHDLLQEMGREIVRRESDRPGNRSRLWKPEDVLDTLKNGDGTDAVQGMVLHMDRMVEGIDLSPLAFQNMKNLRFIKFQTSRPSKYKIRCPNGDLIYLSNQLRSLHWSRCPLKELPSTFKPNNLIHLDLTSSSLKRLWEGTVRAPKLKRLILKGSRQLTSISKCLDAPFLEEIDLEDCEELCDFPSPVKHVHDLNRLQVLNLRGCKSLEQLPSEIHCKSLIFLDLKGCVNLRRIPDFSTASLLWNIILEDCESLLEFPRLSQQLENLSKLDLAGCKNIKSFRSKIHCEFLRDLDLSGCNNLTKFPQISGNITSLNLSGTAIHEVPSSIQNLTKLIRLDLSKCMKLEHISIDICKLKSLLNLDLKNCSKLMSFPEISDTMESMSYLDLRETAVKELPNSIIHMPGLLELHLRDCKDLEKLPDNICNFRSLIVLDLSGCSKLKILPENLENLKDNLANLSINRAAIGKLPNGLVFTSFSDLPRFLGSLYLSDCNLKEIPDDIDYLSSLEYLDLSGNNFESLPESFRKSKVSDLDLDNCTSLQSLTNLPLNLRNLSASDCKQLRSIPDISESEDLLCASFIFTNCLNLKETEVSNILKQVIKEEIEESELEAKLFTDSLKTENLESESTEAEGSFIWEDIVEECKVELRICYPASKVPEWFNQNDEYWIQFQTELRDGVKGQLVGFAICAVLEFTEYIFDCDSEYGHPLEVRYNCNCSDGFQNGKYVGMGSIVVASRNLTLTDSDHVALAITTISSLQKLESEYTNFTFKFWLSEDSCDCRVKSCGVYPIYKKHYITPPSIFNENFGATNQDFGETSVKEHNKIRKFPDEAETSGRSNDDAILEPHPKRTHTLPDLNL